MKFEKAVIHRPIFPGPQSYTITYFRNKEEVGWDEEGTISAARKRAAEMAPTVVETATVE